MSVFIILAMLVCSVVQAEEQTQQPPKLLIVGDSISAGFGVPVEKQWPLLLEQNLQNQFPQLTVVVAAISGDTTSGGRSRLPALLERHQPDVTLLALGGNDALRGTPLSLVRNNLTAMIEVTQESGSEVILAGMQIPPNYGPAYTEGFRTLYIELSGSYNTGLVPFLLEGVATVDGMMQDDGIHPTTEAQPALADNVAPEVIKLITPQATPAE